MFMTHYSLTVTTGASGVSGTTGEDWWPCVIEFSRLGDV